MIDFKVYRRENKVYLVTNNGKRYSWTYPDRDIAAYARKRALRNTALIDVKSSLDNEWMQYLPAQGRVTE